ncbi:radical SAM protein [Sorangium sp. So ce1182]|uniref:radical SAM protein n=1 Tax=Sorangium sp. So ce1182 TaxID=3133334 RepID=UPI003F5FD227
MTVLDTLCIEMTLRCPLRCVHCSANAAPERTEILPARLLSRRLVELAGLQEIYLSGGEPFDHPELPLVVHAARRAAQRVVAYSSGTRHTEVGVAPLLPEQLAAATAEGLGRVDLSFYAANPSAHDEVTRVPGSFAATFATAQQARDQGLPVGIHFVPVPGHEAAVREVLALAQDLGAVRFHALALARLGRGRTCAPAASDGTARLVALLRDLPQRSALEVILSSELRRLLGWLDETPRDRLQTGFLDVDGYLYPSEAQRGVRSRRSLKDGLSFAQLFGDLRTLLLPVLT